MSATALETAKQARADLLHEHPALSFCLLTISEQLGGPATGLQILNAYVANEVRIEMLRDKACKRRA